MGTRKNRFVLTITLTTSLINLPMDLYTLIPRTLVGVVYPAFASLKAVLSGSAEQSAAWLRYWVVLGVFSVLELLADPLINPLSYSFPVWCMAPAKWNGSDLLFNQVLFPLFKEHHKEIEEQAEKAKQSIKDKLGDFFKNEKKENGKKEKLDKIENFFKAKDKPEKAEKEEKSQKQN